jgi:hypothetical protein
MSNILPVVAQGNPSLAKTEAALIDLSSKVNAKNDYDTLTYYSDLFNKRMNKFIGTTPATISYPFKKLIDSKACMVETSEDGLFRIYSWDTWTGGTMHFYRNIFQYKHGNTVKAFIPESEEPDPQNYYSDIYTIKTPGNKTYYLAISNGRYSTKYMSQTIKVFAITRDKLDDKVKLIKTKSGLQNTIDIAYDFFSINDKLAYKDQLIHYDAAQKIIYIPVVHGDDDNGQVSGKFIRYQFTGKYFERI